MTHDLLNLPDFVAQHPPGFGGWQAHERHAFFIRANLRMTLCWDTHHDLGYGLWRDDILGQAGVDVALQDAQHFVHTLYDRLGPELTRRNLRDLARAFAAELDAAEASRAQRLAQLNGTLVTLPAAAPVLLAPAAHPWVRLADFHALHTTRADWTVMAEQVGYHGPLWRCRWTLERLREPGFPYLRSTVLAEQGVSAAVIDSASFAQHLVAALADHLSIFDLQQFVAFDAMSALFPPIP